MIRQVKVRNMTLSDITFKSSEEEGYSIVIPALGSVTMPYKDYLDIAVDSDIEGLGIKVDFPDIEVKRVSVRDFGAKGDGVTNDTKPMQSAIDYVGSYGGGVVDVPIGVYLIDGLYIGENIMLQGESKNDSVLKMRSGANATSITFANINGGLSKLRIVGNS